MSYILFLSSDPVLRQKNRELLSQSGNDTNGVAGCLEGLLMLDKNDYDVVVIDEELSDTSGYDACIKVRQHSNVPIVLLGSATESEVWAKVEDLGFDSYLKKPINPRELMARIKALLRRPPFIEKRAVLEEQKPVQAATSTVSPDLNRPESSSLTGFYEKKIEQGLPKTELVQPVQMVPPIAGEVPETHNLPPQPQVISHDATQPPVQVVPPMPGEVPRTQIPPPSPLSPLQSQQVAPSRVTEPPVQILPPVPSVPEQMLKPQASPTQPTVNYPQQYPQVSKQQPEIVRQPQVQIPQPIFPRPVEPSGSSQIRSEPKLGEAAGNNALEDVRTLKLIDMLVNGKLTEITPIIDLSLKLGYGYPAVDSLMDSTDEQTINVLENLAKNEILIKSPFEKLYADPDGLLQLVPIERCPRCDSSNLIKGQLVEHFNCGYVGLDKDYREDGRYVCPKCHRELRLIGTDYRNIGIHYRCLDCNEVFTSPVVKWRNLKSRKIWSAEELTETTVYSYIFSPDKKGWLEFQLKPKTQLVDFLRAQGYNVQELVQLTGSSGATHTVDILAVRDDILTKIYLGIGILVAAAGESEVSLEALFKFDTRAYDVGINYKVVIAIPKLGYEAANFASRQMIRAFEAKTLASVVSTITSMPQSKISLQSAAEASSVYDSKQTHSSAGSARTIILRFLRGRGYEVFERAQIPGKSGVNHIFDIFARRDDKIITPTITIGISSDPSGQPLGVDEIARFDAAAYDSGIRNKVFLGIPLVSPQARQFARQQRIDILEPNDLNRLV